MSQGNLRSYFTYRLSNVKVISFENINNNFEDLGLDTPLSRPLPFSPLLVPPAILPPKFLKHCWATSTPNAQLFKGSSIVWHPRSWNLHPNDFCEPPSCPSSPHEPPWFTRLVPRKVAQLVLALKPQRSPFSGPCPVTTRKRIPLVSRSYSPWTGAQSHGAPRTHAVIHTGASTRQILSHFPAVERNSLPPIWPQSHNLRPRERERIATQVRTEPECG